MARRYLLVVALPALFSALACSGLTDRVEEEAARKALEMGTGVEIQTNGGTTTTTTTDGATFGSGTNVPLPTGFPADVPLYAGATVSTSAMLSPGNFALGYKAQASQAEVVAFYKEKLAGTFQLTSETSTPDAMLMFSTADYKRAVMITLSGNGPTEVAMGVTATP